MVQCMFRSTVIMFKSTVIVFKVVLMDKFPSLNEICKLLQSEKIHQGLDGVFVEILIQKKNLSFRFILNIMTKMFKKFKIF